MSSNSLSTFRPVSCSDYYPQENICELYQCKTAGVYSNSRQWSYVAEEGNVLQKFMLCGDLLDEAHHILLQECCLKYVCLNIRLARILGRLPI